MWSFGCCVYEMMTLQFAFETPSQKDLIRKILHGEVRPHVMGTTQDITR